MSVESTMFSYIGHWLKFYRPQNTEQTYSGAIKQFVQWCNDRGLNYDPPSDTTVAFYLTELHRSQKSYNTIRVASSSISDLCRYNPTRPAQSQIVQDVKATIKKISPPSKRKKALLVSHIYSIFECCLLDKFINIRDYFLIILAFKTLFRGAEIISILLDDTWIDTVQLDSGVEVTALFVLLQDWKTRNGRGGRTQVICQDIEHPWKCPVTLYSRFLEELVSICTVEGTPVLSHLFCQRNPFGQPLAKTHLNAAIKRLANLAGLQAAGLTGHSTRVGGTTAAFRAGVKRQIIAKHGDWVSDCIDLYYEESIDDKSAVSLAI